MGKHDTFSLVGTSVGLTIGKGARVSTGLQAGNHETLTCKLTWSQNLGTFEYVIEHADRAADGYGPGEYSLHVPSSSPAKVVSRLFGAFTLSFDRSQMKEFVRLRVQNFQGGAINALVGATWSRYAPRHTFNITQTATTKGGVTVIPSITEGVWGLQNQITEPVVTFASGALAFGEGAGTIQIPVILSEPRPVDTEVEWEFGAGTATHLIDFERTNVEPAIIPQFELSGYLEVTLLDDALVEDAETFVVTITDAGDATVGEFDTRTVVITDDDDPIPAPIVNFTGPDRIVAEGTSGRVTIGLDKPAIAPVSITWAVSGGNASGGDYTFTSASPATIGIGAQSVQIELNAVDDLEIEENETVEVTISAASGADLGGDLTRTFTITSDDVPPVPVVQFGGSSPTVLEGAPATLQIVLSSPAIDPVVVSWAVTGGTAEAPGDYTAPQSPTIISTGASSANLVFPTFDDAAVEANETISVQIQSATGADLGADLDRTITITSDDSPPVPTVEFTSTAPIFAENAQGVLTVALSGPSTSDVTIDWAVTGGTATLGTDYSVQGSSPLTIPAGQNSAPITLVGIDDADLEASETIEVTLSNPVNATLGARTVQTATITSDDSGTPGEYGDSGVMFDAIPGRTSTVVYGRTGIDPVFEAQLPELAINGVQADVWPYTWEDGKVDSIRFACKVEHSALQYPATEDVGCVLNSTITTPVSTPQFTELDLSGFQYEFELCVDGMATIDAFEHDREEEVGNWMVERHGFGLCYSGGGSSVGMHTFTHQTAGIDAVLLESALDNSIYNPAFSGGHYIKNDRTAGDVYAPKWRVKQDSIPSGWVHSTFDEVYGMAGSNFVIPESGKTHVYPARMCLARRTVIYNPATCSEAQAKEWARERGVGFVFSGDLAAWKRPWLHATGHMIPKNVGAFTHGNLTGRAAIRARMGDAMHQILGGMASGGQGGAFVTGDSGYAEAKGWFHLHGPIESRSGGEDWIFPVAGVFQCREEVRSMRATHLAQLPRHSVGMTWPDGRIVTDHDMRSNNGGKAVFVTIDTFGRPDTENPHFLLGGEPGQGPGGINPGVATHQDNSLDSLQPTHYPWNGTGGLEVIESPVCFPHWGRFGFGTKFPGSHLLRRLASLAGLADTTGGLAAKYWLKRECSYWEQTLSPAEVDPRGVSSDFLRDEHMPYHALKDIVEHGEKFWGGSGGRTHTNAARIHRTWGETTRTIAEGMRIESSPARRDEIRESTIGLNRMADIRISGLGNFQRVFPGSGFQETTHGQCQYGITDYNARTGASTPFQVVTQFFYNVHISDAATCLERIAKPIAEYESGMERPHLRYGVTLMKQIFASMKRRGTKRIPAYVVTSSIEESGKDWFEQQPDGFLAGVGSYTPFCDWNFRHATDAERSQIGGCEIWSDYAPGVRMDLGSRACVAVANIAAWLYRDETITDVPVLDWAKTIVEGLAGQTFPSFEAAGDWLIQAPQQHQYYWGAWWETYNLSTLAGWLQNANDLLARFPHWSESTGGGDTVPPGVPQNIGTSQLDGAVAITASSTVGYRYQHRIRIKAGGVWSEKLPTVGPAKTFSDLNNGTAYEVAMRAIDEATLLPSPWTSTVTLTPSDGGSGVPPGVPPDLDGVAGDAQVSLSWGEVTE